MKIVIVEDEVRIREGIEKLLKKLDSDNEIVGKACNGHDGLAICREQNPDVVITDIKMPQMDGLHMLSAMNQEGCRAKAIVLSAYSEFEYARRAMKLGVTEYLLKPIALSEFSQALDNVKQQITRDKQKKPAQVGTMEQLFRDIISGRIEMVKETEDYLKNNYQIEPEQSFIMVCVYLGKNFDKELKQSKKQLLYAFSLYAGISYCILDYSHRKSLVLLVYHYEDAHDLERWMQYQILQQVTGHMAIGWTEVEGVGELKQGMDHLYSYMDWNISFKNDILISYPKITRIQTAICIYPIDLEARMKVAICAFDTQKIEELMQAFHQNFIDGKVYHPKEIKECYVRFLWAILEIAKEVGSIDDKGLKQKILLEQIITANTRDELLEVSDFLVKKFQVKKNEDTTHLTVRRVKSMIHEFYNTGITLDEIATKLHITPEYLGTQFHKEMGITFSTYLKNYRIGKAKELLCGTSLKLYEIAERVGYADPKYFSKVFRESTGQLPADYRKTIK